MDNEGMAIIICFFCGMFLGGLGGFACGVDVVRGNATEAKVAEYYIDEDNSKQFHFLTPVPIKEEK